jgi:hypothetical protein
MAAPMSFLLIKINNDESSCSSILFVFQLIQLSKNQSVHFVPKNLQIFFNSVTLIYKQIFRRAGLKKLHYYFIFTAGHE